MFNLGIYGPKIGAILIVLSGLAQALGSAIDGDPATIPNWEILTATLGGGLLGFTARPNRVSSEAVGLKGVAAQATALKVETKAAHAKE